MSRGMKISGLTQEHHNRGGWSRAAGLIDLEAIPQFATQLPPRAVREALKPGDVVKVMTSAGEPLWVEVVEVVSTPLAPYRGAVRSALGSSTIANGTLKKIVLGPRYDDVLVAFGPQNVYLAPGFGI